MSSSKRPRLLVFAGPNGSGKSTVTSGIPIVGEYINADVIKEITDCSDLEAARMAEKARHRALDLRKDLTFETVLSTDRNLEFLKEAKEAGYEILAVYVLTVDSEINVSRVRHRAKMGGHDVPEDKIRKRYGDSLERVSELIRIADRTRILDNTGKESQMICEVEGNTVRLIKNNFWSEEEILILLSGRGRY